MIDEALDRAEQSLDAGKGLKGTGFWQAVSEVRRDRALAEQYADRIARIDRRAFERGVSLRVRAPIGVLALAVVSVLGALAVTLAYRAGEEVPTRALLFVGPSVDAYAWPGFVPVAFLAGLACLIVGTHSLAHWIVGRLAGIRFTHVFLGGPPPPRPGVKTDYASYLRASALSRALMHASGAVVTKLVPFALIPFVPDIGQRGWLVWTLVGIGIVQIATDVFLSTKVSDWMKFRRELSSR